MKLPHSLTTVTTFSKLLAILLFFTFIASAFVTGMQFQGKIDLIKYQQSNLVTAKPSPTPDPTASWKTYVSKNFGYSFKYPSDYKSYAYASENSIFHSPDAQYDKITTAKTKGIDIGSVVYGPGEDLKKDSQRYIGINTQTAPELISKLILPSGYRAKAYVGLEDITVAIDYKKNNENMRLLIWCGGENGNPIECKNLLTLLLPTFKFISSTDKTASITPTCQPRPACLDSVPRCLIPETSDMCPKVTPIPNSGRVACPQIAKLCPDGKNYTSPSGPNCEFSPCP